jgi:hypothetical protein
MSDAADKLARTRLAIIAHLQRQERHHERRDNEEYDEAYAQQHGGRDDGQRAWSGTRARGRGASGWFGRIKHALGAWWRHHPAHMGVELATPVLADYAARKPAQYLAIAAALGAVVVVVRPWRLISVTGLVVALVKSSQLSSLVLSAMAGVGDERDPRPPE